MRSRSPPAAVVTLVALGYLILGAAGLTLAIPPGYASPVFPAAGLALACLLLYGWRALPGIWLGSFLLNLGTAALGGTLTPATAAVAALIATGSSAQAAVGRALVGRWPGSSWRTLEREVEVLRFLLLGGVVASVVAASASAPGLVLAGLIDRADLGFTWWTWYMGDALGILVFAPLSLCFLDRADPIWRDRRRRLAGPMLLTLFLVALAFVGTSRWSAQAQRNELEAEAQRIVTALSDRLTSQREVLASMRNFAEALPGFTFEQFEQFTRLTLRDNPDVFALSYNDLVADAHRDEFERLVSRLSPLGPFQITERDAQRRLVRASRRPEYVTVRYIVPLEGNKPAVGYDIHSEPIRRVAIAQAIASRGMAVTAPIRLVQEERERTGLLAMLPVTDATATDAGGMPRITGFAVAVIKIDEFVAIATRGRWLAGLVFEIDDPGAPDGRSLLYRSAGWSTEQGREGRSTPRWSTSLRVGSRDWTVTVAMTMAHVRMDRPWLAWAVGVVGLLFAALLQLLLLGATGRAALIQRQNEEMRANDRALRDNAVALQENAEALRASGTRLREAQRLAGVGDWELDVRTSALTCSDEVFRIFEMDPRQGGVTVDAFRSVIDPEDRGAVLATYRRSLESDAPYAVTYRLRMPDGRTKYVQERCQTHFSAEGIPLRSVGTVQDVSEVRALQEKLAHASRLAALGTLVAGVGHEVNNPLAAAMANDGAAFADLGDVVALLQKDGPLDRAELIRLISDAQESVGSALASDKRIASIVKDLVMLGRAEGSRTRVKVMDVVDQALRWLHASIARSATIEVDNQGAPDVIASPGQLGQVVINLVNNGAKAIPAGRMGRVRIRVGPGAPGTACIEVSDDGVGMTPEIMSRVFDPFYTTREVGEGMGLGLPICHSIVVAHGGTLTVESVPGKGSTFRVELPAAQA